ncbi:hypothetical protein IU443_07485 [Nocardia farcinica]|uniref:hypothetical protein n=1 Tax=Nocardia farcinica TaxID=37329 RepID=UPI000DFD46E7|nr:hypothetical protein [Nocardia farcinica]MBA4857091.1 hypothetical protein [Nocardia farcinica]MBC9817168.1 hypothetical protein [Nocardia farcinica]MBF6262716.1 hypothetical protein [Nocardia farcinica]MBF6281220.1 hypothetical protein [Nocardia farcinica]MBF6305984.1 hypothetical protein [Nocardia farcinica]
MTDAERQAKALELKGAGWSYYDIAKALEYPGESVEHEAASGVIALEPEVVILRQLQDIGLMVRGLAPAFASGDRKAIALMKRIRRHALRLDIDAAREYARRRGLPALPPEVEELIK